MPEFSTTTQALLDAVCSNTEPDCDTQHLIAAAIEALADRVVPEEEDLNPVDAWSVEDWNHMNITRYQREETRRQLLAIAAELRGQNQSTRGSDFNG